MMIPGVVILSGGLDSAVLLSQVVADTSPDQVKAITFNYGQRHFVEASYATQQARHYGVEHKIIDLTSITELLKGSSQTDRTVEVPDGHYAEETMKATVVPNRNMIMLSIAAAWAISSKLPGLYFGAHAGDHTIYPDCRADFVFALSQAMLQCDWHPVKLFAPFARIHKSDIVKLGHAYKVPMHLTYSCYKGWERHCGQCGTCSERREAFTLAGVKDPTEYLK